MEPRPFVLYYKTQELEWLGMTFNTENTFLNGIKNLSSCIKDEIKLNSSSSHPHLDGSPCILLL